MNGTTLRAREFKNYQSFGVASFRSMKNVYFYSMYKKYRRDNSQIKFRTQFTPISSRYPSTDNLFT